MAKRVTSRLLSLSRLPSSLQYLSSSRLFLLSSNSNNYYHTIGLRVPPPRNEPVLEYRKGSKERAEIQLKIKEIRAKQHEIPLIIDGKEIKSSKVQQIVIPHDNKHVLATYHCAQPEHVQLAIESSLKAKEKWAALRWEDRAAIFLKAAELLAGPWRQTMNAATVVGQSKTYHQAEIDAACETIDFFRFNVAYAETIYAQQPISAPGIWNHVLYRPLEGFVYSVTPFNFAAIGANLSSTPAIVGNTVIWKPSSAGSLLNNYYMMKLWEEAGLPAGVINFLCGDSASITNTVFKSGDLAGIHYTGSTNVFNGFWRDISNNIERYKTYPRIVGETGGKDFIFAHQSADIDALVTAIIRGGFEYAGQKCSACSRVYIPDSIWDKVKAKLVAHMKRVKTGNPERPETFVNAVIHKRSFDNCKSYLQHAKANPSAFEILCGGSADDSVGYFVDPTIVVSRDPKSKLMTDEIFGPIVTIYVYNAQKYVDALKLCDESSPYALTGAVFARDREALVVADKLLENAAGNFYINDKPTGAVVGQQPFGGARMSGTNDKAGSLLNLNRWISVRAVKETFVPPTDFAYPFMESD